ncbi:helix-turn-helix domain-containing protein [Fusobacterium necrophorum]|jgi:predicted transcriptional regulator|uniref:helix-turn-helix domain-containing protein n=1 Tax=Fusobacterium necrophorum TaxID=859 RepID=UPI0009E5C2C5|nr:helix-turn-helix domain-containing protein [Fusobacterium necrophorum]
MKKIDFEMSVKKALRIKKISLSKMAKELGISKAYCSDLVRGNRVSEKRIRQIKKFLEI